MDREELSRKAMALARKYAERVFSRRRERDELIADAEAWAWEFAQTAGPRATLPSIAWYAVKRVTSKRRFRGSSRSIDHPRHRPQWSVSGMDVADYSRSGDNPSLIVMAKLDTAAWLQTLTARHKAITLLYAAGWRTEEIAELFGVTSGRISQIRKELLDLWQEFQDG